MKVQVVNWSMHLFAPRNQGPLWWAECVKSLHTVSAVTDVSILHGWVVQWGVEFFESTMPLLLATKGQMFEERCGALSMNQ